MSTIVLIAIVVILCVTRRHLCLHGRVHRRYQLPGPSPVLYISALKNSSRQMFLCFVITAKEAVPALRPSWALHLGAI